MEIGIWTGNVLLSVGLEWLVVLKQRFKIYSQTSDIFLQEAAGKRNLSFQTLFFHLGIKIKVL